MQRLPYVHQAHPRFVNPRGVWGNTGMVNMHPHCSSCVQGHAAYHNPCNISVPRTNFNAHIPQRHQPPSQFHMIPVQMAPMRPAVVRGIAQQTPAPVLNYNVGASQQSKCQAPTVLADHLQLNPSKAESHVGANEVKMDDKNSVASVEKPKNSSIDGNLEIIQTRNFMLSLSEYCISSCSDIGFEEMANFLSHGSKVTAYLAKMHPTHPCFQRIDYVSLKLMTRMENSEKYPLYDDNSLPLVIKEFLFVFSRIVSSWVKVKRYVKNDSPVLSNIQSNFTPQFIKSFQEWENSSLALCCNIMKTALKLNERENYKNFN